MRWARSSLLTILLVVLGFPTASLAATGSVMRCGNNLVKRGDSQFKVLQYCGEPIYVEQGRSSMETHWIYYTRRGLFAKIVHIKNGRVTRIASGERLP